MKSLENATSALSLGRSSKGKKDKKKITTVTQKPDSSYKVAPLTARMSAREKAEMAEWVKELQEMTGRNVTTAKVIRALIAIRDDISDEDIISKINEMN
ncbi:hypothetical protein P7F88_25150 [Vibrio hannami]|uniref:hypothetical protein n=1 Tax=Vibrio hannami TaxID=2717094 RepID=UPI0024106A69|nr:hypothetical protein [Vibrio hannami]MDG3089152.1 hypothetical protein [Vibrio hannami]